MQKADLTNRRSALATLAAASLLTERANAMPLESSSQGAIDVTSFGAKGDGRTWNDDAFAAALAHCRATRQALIVPHGSYLLRANGLNFGLTGMQIVGLGRPILKFVGPGLGLRLEAEGNDGAFLTGISIEGLVIEGNAETTAGFFSRGIARSCFRDIEVREIAGKAFHIKHGVSCQFDSLRYVPTDTNDQIKGTHGLYLDSNGAGYYSADCTFINAVCEGFRGIGCEISDGSGNIFIGGTFESCRTGLVIGQSSNRNHFNSLWFEDNAEEDAVISGNLNGFTNCLFSSASHNPNLQVASGGTGTMFTGGYLRTLLLHPASRDTRLFGCALDQNRSNTLGVRGGGSWMSYGALMVDDQFGVVGALRDT